MGWSECDWTIYEINVNILYIEAGKQCGRE